MKMLLMVLTLTFVGHGATAGQTFANKRILLGGKEIEVEIADNDAKRSQGLMNRKTLLENHGMLFTFDSPEVLIFWMKNTLIPLSIGYFDAQKKLVTILEMRPGRADASDASLPRYSSRVPALYALEMPTNWFKKNHIELGAQFKMIESRSTTAP
jgi:uncharacterized membrane protein (UPF0127 family)